ncbi:hypothetical protein ABW21_db0207709 [Orbilia brochopaga]|nr:hypothetical protein ABW21_db0207709 [Drechslerella brochopaga]
MATLASLLADLPEARIVHGNSANIVIYNLAYDPDKISAYSALICVPPDQDFEAEDVRRGTPTTMAAVAVSRGAIAIISEDSAALATLPPHVTGVLVPDARRALALMACEFYRHPSRKLLLVGITGTNGKTTTAHLTAAVLRASPNIRSVGVIGTLGATTETTSFDTGCTTPRSLDTQRLLAQFIDAGVDAVVMEVSSHGLALQRVVGCAFDIALFTNFSQDHLDFHATMGEYWHAKMLFFTTIARDSQLYKLDFTAIVNVDDRYGQAMLRNVAADETYAINKYGIEQARGGVCAQNVQVDPSRIQFDMDIAIPADDSDEKRTVTVPFTVPLTGRFNVYNALAAIAVGMNQEIPLPAIRAALLNVTRPAGRMEFIDEGQEFTVVVDYAHGPESLKVVLKALRELVTGSTNILICVFGCGGDRDASKRPQMGDVAASLADLVVVTSDNPRSEDPAMIIEEVMAGMFSGRVGEEIRATVEVDRRQAIEYAIQVARPGDVILLAGKGHETYQILKDRTVHFDDREVAREALSTLKRRDVHMSKRRRPNPD